MRTGDVLTPMFWGTPGCRAWFAVPGVADSITMIEIPPREQAFWGEAVFGSGAVPESLLVNGIYAGYYEVPESVSVVDTPLIYHLRPPSAATLAHRVIAAPRLLSVPRVVEWLEGGDSIAVACPSDYKVSLNDPAYPFAVRLKDSVQVMRHGPRKGYFSILQPKGVEVLVIGREGDWYRTRLSATQIAWVDTVAVERLPQGHQLPNSHVTSMRTFAKPEYVRLEIPLKGKHAFRVTETAARHVCVQLFGVTSDTDWIRYDTQATLVSLARWSQPEPGVYQVDLELSKDIWGYDAYYVGNAFVLQLNLPPERVHGLHGKRIVVDPGHSPDPGAIGPTGYTEAEANLGIALELAAELRRKGRKLL
jgi:N-acetylmuramoyl-L-alanine amidase